MIKWYTDNNINNHTIISLFKDGLLKYESKYKHVKYKTLCNEFSEYLKKMKEQYLETQWKFLEISDEGISSQRDLLC